MKNQSGQTLVEILLAFSIAIVILGAVVAGITMSISSSQHAKNQSLANSYAQEAMAILKNARDKGEDLSSLYPDPNYCLAEDSSALTTDLSGEGCAQNVGGVFSRQVFFEHSSNTSCEAESGVSGSRVIARVSWSDSRCSSGSFSSIYCHKVDLISCMFNIDKAQSP
jgi:type II secretory pathway pseudopilin PulG